MKVSPVKFEIVDEALGESVGKVSLFDEGSAEVDVGDYIFDLESWRTFSAAVEMLLVRQMDMDVTGQ